jgi:hypothetical protein
MAFCTAMFLALYFDVMLAQDDIAEFRVTFGLPVKIRKVAMNGQIWLIATLLSAVAGCESYSWSVYNNPLIPDVKQGQDCRVLVFGLGGSVDPTGREAMRLGDITRVRNTEFRVNTIQGVGNECVIAHGE